jgi:hypothetical protein
MPRRFEFEFSRPYRLAALPLGITPRTTYVELTGGSEPAVRVRFGPWSLRTPVSNVRSAQRTGPFTYVKTAGPPRLSFTDRGVSFATNGDEGVCMLFHEPVAAIAPGGMLRHPGATVTVRDCEGLLGALS